MKSLALVGIGIGLGTVVLAFCLVRPAAELMAIQCLGWTFAAASLVMLVGLELRRDLVPDYLSRCKKKFFERDGFCFGISLDREDGRAIFTVFFQSRFVGPSTARIALRPAGSRLATISPDIECGPAGFGVAKFPVAIPLRHQGKTVTFEIGADAEYPLGKGREIRFRSGRTIRHNSRFRSLAVAAQMVLHSLAGHFFIHAPAVIRFKLPSDVAEFVPEEQVGESQLLWSLSESEPLHPSTAIPPGG